PLAKSSRSTSAVRSPRLAASRATPQPVIPPPTTRTSKGRSPSCCRARSRSKVPRATSAATAGAAAAPASGGERGAGRRPTAGAGHAGEHREQARGVAVADGTGGGGVRIGHRPALLERGAAGTAPELVGGHAGEPRGAP